MPKSSQASNGQAVSEQLGFLAAGQDQTHQYIGGLLVTTERGRPLEFHYSLPIRPTETHRVLYGKELEPHIFETLIGTALLEQAQQSMLFLVTDQPLLLGLRSQVDLPIVAAKPKSSSDSCELGFNADFPEDSDIVSEWLERHASLDISEPLLRIWEALRDVINSDSKAAA